MANSWIVIPARYGSSRFPGKPLAVLEGKPILQRVWEIADQVCRSRSSCQAVIATEDPEEVPDSQKIIDFCREKGFSVLTTPSTCRSGSDRVLAVANRLTPHPEILVNMQGDNPLCPVAFVMDILDKLEQNADLPVASVCTRLTWEALDALRESKKKSPFSGTTVTLAADGRALWFSKTILPALRDENKLRDASSFSPVYRHIGLYGYRYEALSQFAQLEKGVYERLEQLEQLRFLENGIPIAMIPVVYPKGLEAVVSGIDSQEDLIRTAALIQQNGDYIP